MTHPDPSVAKMVQRVPFAPGAAVWTGDDERGEHHGLVSLNHMPFYMDLFWKSSVNGQTIHIGTYKLSLRDLVNAGYAIQKPHRMVRLRFARDSDGTIEIRPNDSSPGLPVGSAWPTRK